MADVGQTITPMEAILIKALQLICCFSLLVFVHEGGHFLFAKFSGVKVEKFYLFFNPYFHLFSTRDKWFTRLFPYFKDNETEYGIGWIPLGGYVSIAGMIDETKTASDVASRPSEESDFNRKPVWRRFLIMVGGVLFNLITALVIYQAIMYTWGQEVLPMRNLPNGLNFNARAQAIGFRNGDTPIRVDGKEIDGYSGALMMAISEAGTVTVLRDGNEVDIQMPEEGVSLLEMQKLPHFYTLPIKPIVGEAVKGHPAQQAGMVAGTLIMGIDSVATPDYLDVERELARRRDIINAAGCTAGDSLRAKNVAVTVMQPGATTPDTLQLTLADDIKLGVLWDDAQLRDIPTEHRTFTFLESIPAGCSLAWNTLTDYVVSLKYLFHKEGIQQVGSFLTIGNLFPSTWNWHDFWSLTAFISIILAVMNILPIPGLDGGHIMLLLYEGIAGRQPSAKAMDIIEKVGLFLILSLMVLACGNDIMRFFF